jgi:hypothetical protein
MHSGAKSLAPLLFTLRNGTLKIKMPYFKLNIYYHEKVSIKRYAGYSGHNWGKSAI